MSVDEWLEKMDMTEYLDKGPFSSGSNEKSINDSSDEGSSRCNGKTSV